MSESLKNGPAAADCALAESEAPQLAPRSMAEMLKEAEALLEFIGGEPLAKVAEHAGQLAVCARNAGELEIAQAAEVVLQAARTTPAVLTIPLQRLSNAINAAQAAHAIA